jgi:hypothetical protein
VATVHAGGAVAVHAGGRVAAVHDEAIHGDGVFAAVAAVHAAEGVEAPQAGGGVAAVHAGI